MKDDEWYSYHEGRRIAEKQRNTDVERQNERDRAWGSSARTPTSAAGRTAPASLNARERLFWYRSEILDEIRKCRDLDRRFRDDWTPRLNAIDMFAAGADERLLALASAVRRAADEEERSYLRGTSASASGLLGATMSLVATRIEALADESGSLSKSGG